MEKKIIINSEAGIHARPASAFVKAATGYETDIFLIKDGKEYNGKSIMSILSMGATKGTELIIRLSQDMDASVLDELSNILLEVH